MALKKHTSLAPAAALRNPFSLFRQMTTDFERMFDDSMWPSLRLPAVPEVTAWSPGIDVFEKDNRLVTKVDLPGMKKEDVKVEVADGYLTIAGERKRELEEKKAGIYRSEREYGRFSRSVPLPDGVKLEDIKATFADGVLEVSVPLPARAQPEARQVAIEEPATGAKSAA